MPDQVRHDDDRMNPLAPFLPWFDLFGIAVFAASGALAAARRGQTFVTFAFFALVTGVGGGTVRDLLIDAPVFWVQDWRVAAVCLGMALLIWLTPHRWWHGRALDWFDAVGLAAYAVFGAAKALAFGVPPVVGGLMGGVTPRGGGSKRDVLEPLLILLTPYAPHIAEELWHQLGNQSSVLDAAYPTFEAQYLVESTKDYPVSINGKMRTQISIDLSATQEQVQEMVLANEVVQKWMEGKPLKKLIFVKGKMVNVVV